MSLLEHVSDISEHVPGWTVIVLTITLIAMLLGGRILDIMDTVSHGVEKHVNQTIGEYMVNYDYRQLARNVWSAVAGVLVIVVILFWIGKAVNALRRGGEEL